MAKDLEEIERLMTAHEQDPRKVDPKEEITYTIKQIIKYLIQAFVSIIILGLIIAIFSGKTDLSAIWKLLVNLSGYMFLVFGLFATLSYYAGRGTYMGEMTRRAWTNSRRNSDMDMRRDFTSFIDTPQIIYSLFLASLIVILIDYSFFS